MSEPLDDELPDVLLLVVRLLLLDDVVALETVFDDSELVDRLCDVMELDDELVDRLLLLDELLPLVWLVTVESEDVDLDVSDVAVELLVAVESDDVDRLLSDERLDGVFDDSLVAVLSLDSDDTVFEVDDEEDILNPAARTGRR